MCRTEKPNLQGFNNYFTALEYRENFKDIWNIIRARSMCYSRRQVLQQSKHSSRSRQMIIKGAWNTLTMALQMVVIWNIRKVNGKEQELMKGKAEKYVCCVLVRITMVDVIESGLIFQCSTAAQGNSNNIYRDKNRQSGGPGTGSKSQLFYMEVQKKE